MSEATTIVVDTEDDSVTTTIPTMTMTMKTLKNQCTCILQIQYLHSVCLKTRFGIFVQSVTLMITLRVTFVERKMNHKLLNSTL